MRQTDRQTSEMSDVRQTSDKRLMPPPYGGGGIITSDEVAELLRDLGGRLSAVSNDVREYFV